MHGQNGGSFLQNGARVGTHHIPSIGQSIKATLNIFGLCLHRGQIRIALQDYIVAALELLISHVQQHKRFLLTTNSF